MKRLIARWLGIRYLGVVPAAMLIGNYFDAVWEAARCYQREDAIPENVLEALHQNHDRLMQALTRGV